MPNAIIFYYGDIGYNFRLLQHAKSFSSISESHVYLIGSDDHALPKEIEKSPNISFMPIIFFHPFPYLSFFFFPFQMIFSLFQLFFICLSISSADFVFCSTENLLIDIICCYTACKIFNAKLIIDILPFKWMNSNRLYKFLLKKIEFNQFRFADLCIVSTQAMQIILKVQKIKSILIRDFPGTLFYSNSKKKNKFMAVDNSNSFFISVPLNKKYADDHQFLNWLESLGRMLNENNINVTFFIFGSFNNQSFNEFSENITSEKKENCVKFKFYPINSYQYSSLLQFSDVVIIFEGSKYGLDLTPEIIQVASLNIPVIIYKYGCVCEIYKNSKLAFFFKNRNEFLNIFKQIFIQKEIDLYSLETDRKNIFDWTDSWNKSVLEFIQNNI